MSDLDDDNEEVRSGRGRRESGGASIRIQDPLFRKFMMASWAFFGTCFMGMQIWLVSTVSDIKAALPRLADKDIQIDQHLANTDRYAEKLDDREDRHYDYLKGKVDQYEGKTLRGPLDLKHD